MNTLLSPEKLRKIIKISAVLSLISISFLLLFFKINSHPNSLYNWESYTLWKIYQVRESESHLNFHSYFQLTDGLMTDSGQSPFIGLPINMITRYFGMDLWQIRLWSALLSMAGILYYYFFAKKLFNSLIAYTSTILLLGSQAFLLYARTGINVGGSLLPELIAISLIYEIWRKPARLRYYFFLCIIFIINSFFYAPIRFLIPFGMMVICIRLLVIILPKYGQFYKKSPNTQRLFSVIILFQLLNTLLLIYLNFNNKIPLLSDNVLKYYHGRGEQVVTQIKDKTVNTQKAVQLMRDNTVFLYKLYLNRDTKPTLTDFWNPNGQIINSLLVPFFIFGLLYSIYRIKNFKYALIAAWFLITSIPIVFTSNVHAGRLFFSFAPLYILISIGINVLLNIVCRFLQRIRRIKPLYCTIGRYVVILIFCCTILTQEASAFFKTNPTPDSVKMTIDNNLPLLKRNDIILANMEGETLRGWEVYYYLAKHFNVKDYSTGKVIAKNANVVNANNVYFKKTIYTQKEVETICSKKAIVILVGLRSEIYSIPHVCGITYFTL